MKVKFFATYRDVTSCKETDIPAPVDVWSMLALLGDRYGEPIRLMLYAPDGAGISENAIILVNGRSIAHLDDKDTPLREADVVCVFPMVAGG